LPKDSNSLSLHDKALVVTTLMIKTAQEETMKLFNKGFLSRKDIRSGKALMELIIFFINLWMSYRSEDASKISFFESIIFWTRHCLTHKDGARMDDNSANNLFKLLVKRSAEYVIFQNENKANENYNLMLSEKVYANLIGKEQKDPLPLMHLWIIIQSYMKFIHVFWEQIKLSKQ